MAHAKLTIVSPDKPELEMEIHGEVSVGRALDNLIRIDDQMVSHYHAVIERRGESFWLSDLGSTNGTTLNGGPVLTERRLGDGDSISIAGVAVIEFRCDESLNHRQARPDMPFTESIPAANADEPAGEIIEQSSQEAATARASPLWIIAAAFVGVALAAGAVMLITNAFGDSASEVRILSPEAGTTIRGPQTVRIETDGAKDIEEIIYLLDGVEFASAEHPPFEVMLDPAQLESKVRNLESGNHVLTVTVQDKDGTMKPQSETVLLAFDTSGTGAEPIETKKPDDATSKQADTLRPRPGSPDAASLSRNLAAAISGKSWFDFDSQLADEIRNRTDSYRVNVIEEASRYRRQIGNAFNSKGLPPAIGFVMALSESRFKEDTAAGSNQKIGFWQVPRQIALEQGYIFPDETAADLKDVKRSAEIAASYINDLINAFGGMDNFMYAIACYGMPLSEAAKARARLEEIDPNATARKDFWRMAKSGVVNREGIDRVARFFAAGIVSENPQLFGLNCRSLSSLY